MDVSALGDLFCEFLAWRRRRGVWILGPTVDAETWASDSGTWTMCQQPEVSVMLQIPVGKQCTVTAVFKDKAGNPADVEAGSATWAVNDPALWLFKQSPADQLQCTVKGTGTLGTGYVSCTADADLGEGAKPQTLVLGLVSLPGEATGGEIVAGPLQDEVEVNPQATTRKR